MQPDSSMEAPEEWFRVMVIVATLTGASVLLFVTIKLLLAACRGFRLYVLSQCCCRGDTLKYGQWAVITGATDGIGQSMAKEFARRGHSILVIGRNKEKLARTKELLEREPNVGQVETLKIDLSDSSLENYARIEGQLDADRRDIGIMVNNAGLHGDSLQRFAKFDLATIREIMNVNMHATVYFTRLVLPAMLSRQRGLLLNVSSLGGRVPALYLGIYGSTKTFVSRFSETLQMEYASHPIDIVCLEPGFVRTKLYTSIGKEPNYRFLTPSPDEYAKCAINALSARINSFTGTWDHALTWYFSVFVNSIGLLPLCSKLNLMLFGKEFKLSPVAKRRKGQPGESVLA